MQPEMLPFNFEDFTHGELEQLGEAIKALPPLPTGTHYTIGWVRRAGPLGAAEGDRVLTSLVVYPENAPALYWLRGPDGSFMPSIPETPVWGGFNKSYVGLRH